MTEVVRIREPRRRVLRIVPGLLCLIPMTLHTWWWATDGPTATWVRVLWCVVTGVVALLAGLTLFRPDGVDLRADAAVVVTIWGRREVPWAEIQAVTIEWQSLVLHRTSGKPVHTVYPRASWLWSRQFATDYHRIGQWWLAHRGADWRPTPSGPPPGTLAAARPPLPDRPRSVEEIWRSPLDSQASDSRRL